MIQKLTQNCETLRNQFSKFLFLMAETGIHGCLGWMKPIQTANTTGQNGLRHRATWYAAFNSAGDNIRKKATIITASVSWSNHYPSDAYLFMHKFPSKFNSIIKIRLADILLLKAEAYVNLGNLAEAANAVNKVRARVNLPNLSPPL